MGDERNEAVGQPGRDDAASTGRRRVLVVVDRAIVDVASVPDAVLRAEQRADDVYVIAPILTSRAGWLTNDDVRWRDEASERLASVLHRMRTEQGIAAEGRLGDESPLTAIDDALKEFATDEIIIIVHDDEHRHWRERGMAKKIRRRYTQPLIEVLVRADGSTSAR